MQSFVSSYQMHNYVLLLAWSVSSGSRVLSEFGFRIWHLPQQQALAGRAQLQPSTKTVSPSSIFLPPPQSRSHLCCCITLNLNRTGAVIAGLPPLLIPSIASISSCPQQSSGVSLTSLSADLDIR